MRKTEYEHFETSEGGGSDMMDDEGIRCLMHDAWTCWVHSGAPLLLGVGCIRVGMRGRDEAWGARGGDWDVSG